MSILFINPIHKNITLSLIEWWELLEKNTIESWKDFDTFPEMLYSLIQWRKPEQIWVILWPWTFTRMRIVTLTLSTLVLSLWIKVKWCHFFELIDDGIPLLQANREEYITLWEDANIIFLKKEFLRPGTYIWYGNKNDFTGNKNFIEYTENWEKIEKIFTWIWATSVLSPIYLKEPHITWSKKNMSLSWEKMKK